MLERHPAPQSDSDHTETGGVFMSQAGVKYPVKPLWQGNTNGCGTTSLAMALNCLAEMYRRLDQPVTQQELDQKRPFDLYCAPGTLVKLAEARGYFAQPYNQATFDYIKSHLDQGRVIIALHNAVSQKQEPGPLHYLLIHGYHDGPDKAQQRLFMVDPGREDQCSAQFELGYLEFCTYWSRLKLGRFPICVSGFMVVVSAKDDLPVTPKSKLPITIHLANFFHSLANWYAAFR